RGMQADSTWDWSASSTGTHDDMQLSAPHLQSGVSRATYSSSHLRTRRCKERDGEIFSDNHLEEGRGGVAGSTAAYSNGCLPSSDPADSAPRGRHASRPHCWGS